jgi:hypothetical protein
MVLMAVMVTAPWVDADGWEAEEVINRCLIILS